MPPFKRPGPPPRSATPTRSVTSFTGRVSTSILGITSKATGSVLRTPAQAVQTQAETAKEPTSSLSISSLGIPVDTARAYDGCLVPRLGGGWNWIKPFYTAPNLNPVEFIVARLEGNSYQSCMEGDWFPGKAGRYPTPPGNFGPKHQCRAPNGWVFMPAASCKVYAYKPETELVHDLGRVQEPTGGNVPDSSTYAFVFNESGSLLFGSSVATASGPNGDHRPCAFTVDTATGAIAFKSRVGTAAGRTLNAYGYFAAVVNGIGYTMVGEEFWELVATNLTTGISTVLATETENGWGYLENVPGKGMVARLAKNVHVPGLETNRRWWLIDGALVPYVDGQDPPVLINATPYSNVATNIPEIDESSLPQHVVKWRASPSSPWISNRFAITYSAPVPVNSLTALPDGSVFGDVEQYQGYFRVGANGEIENLGTIDPPNPGVAEGSARVIVNGLLYFSGYANGPLYVYDPSKPWDGITNPKFLQYFAPSGTLSSIKRANALAYAAGRIFMGGLRDRAATGAGIGYYDLATKKYGGHYLGLEDYNAHIGLLAFPDRVVFGGLASSGDAQLIFHDLNLVETDRHTPGPRDTGRLFRTAETSVIVGVSIADALAYRWDASGRSMLGTVDLSKFGPVGVMTQAPGGKIVAVLGTRLVAIDPLTLGYAVLGELPSGPVTCIAMTDDRTGLIAVGAEVFRVAIP